MKKTNHSSVAMLRKAVATFEAMRRVRLRPHRNRSDAAGPRALNGRTAVSRKNLSEEHATTW